MSGHITISPAKGTWIARLGDIVIARSSRALEMKEGTRAPVIYFPREDADMNALVRTDTSSTCVWKGQASYFAVKAPGGTIADAIWSYESPKDEVREIAGHLAFYTNKVTVERA